MFRFDRILYPIDFSDRCRGAGYFVEALGRRFDAEILMLHVVETPAEMYGPVQFPPFDLIEARLQSYLRMEFEGLRVRRVTVPGHPAVKIAEISAREKADLIVMPTHGYGPFRRFILGSVTAKVLHDVHCPVLTGAHMEEAHSEDAFHIRNILCAVDLGNNALPAVTHAEELARELGAALTVVHAVPATDARPDKYFDAELEQELARVARAEISDMLDKAGLSARICIAPGEPAKVVRLAAEHHHADLVVIGRSAHGLLGRLRTHGYAIVRESPCPVLSL